MTKFRSSKKAKTAILELPDSQNNLGADEIKNLLIALPSIEFQAKIADLGEKIDNAVNILNGFQKKLALNPISSTEKQKKLERIIEDISESFIETEHPLLCEESIKHEFKSSLRIPYPKMPSFERLDNGKKLYKLGNEKFFSK